MAKKFSILLHFLHCSDDEENGEVHPNGHVKVVLAVVVGHVTDHVGNDGGQAVRQQRANQIPSEGDTNNNKF